MQTRQAHSHEMNCQSDRPKDSKSINQGVAEMFLSRTVLTLAAILVCASLIQAQSLKTEYDRFEDITTASTDTIRIKVLERNERREGKLVLVHPEVPFWEVNMMAMYKYKGEQKPATPGPFVLGYVTKSDEWVFGGDADLYAIVDGERLKVARLSRGGEVQRFLNSVNVQETLITSLPAETFLKIANAKKVEMRLGKFEFGLTEDQLKALHGLAEYATSNKSVSSSQQ
jgi:hypothetical protein